THWFRRKSQQTTPNRSSGFTPRPPFWQPTHPQQTRLCISNTLSRHKVAATKTHIGFDGSRSKQHITVAAGLPRDLRFNRQLILYKHGFVFQTRCRDIKSLLQKHTLVSTEVAASNT
ncbi:hypothetical protein, partial [Pseudoalteromonas sp. HM-SA03]|uniref:hypothetical protein n=1 Tax=Pseudoalteromonas sp. HM-SA03 TaxID=2029678 RepID=UPI001C3EA19C